MKLHLPKALLTAVLAVYVSPATWATSDDTANSGWGKITTTNNNQTVPATNSYAIGDATIQSIDTTDSSSTDSTLFIRSNNGVSSATVENFIIGAGDTAKIDGWYNENVDHPEFSNLTIKNLTFNNSSLYVESANKVQVNALSGTAKEITVNGSLSVGTAGVSQIISVSDKISVGAGGTLTVDGGTLKLTATDDKTLTAANAEIIVNKGAVLQLVDTDTIDYSASNMKITLDGGELALGAKRQTLGHTTLTLKDGKVTSLKADNTACFGDNYGALDINQTDSAIVSSGTSSIQGGVRLRVTGQFNVTDGTLTVDSIFNGNSSGAGIVKDGDGTLKITSMSANNQNETFYKGNTEIKAGTIEYALAANTSGTYSGTISGTGNIVNSGSGEVTLNKISNLNGDITVSAGKLTVKALEVGKTMGVSVSDGAVLILESVSIDAQRQLDKISVNYSDNEEGVYTPNGFETGVYRLFDGYEWNGSISGYDVSLQDGDTLVTSDGVGSTYYINEGTHKISDSSDYVKERAQGYSVAKDANLVINGSSGSLTAAQLLTGTLGDGNITVSTDVTLTPGTSTQATGNLTVQNAKITLDTTGDHNQIKLKETSMSSFSSVTLDNAILEYVGATTSLNNVTVTSNGANLKFRDMATKESEYQLKGTTTLNGNLTVGKMEGTAWKYTLNIEALTGAGDLSFTSAGETGKLNISSMQGYIGAITVTKGDNGAATLNATTGGAVNLKGITLAGGATGTLAVSGAANLGDVNIGTGSLSISNTGTTTATTTLKTLKGSGSLSFTGNEAERTLVISSLQEYTGSLSLTKGTGATSLAASANGDNNGLVNLKGVTLSNGADGWIKVKNPTNSSTSSLGTVSLSGGSDLRIWNVGNTGITNISSLTVSGSATLGTYRDGTSYQGTVNIASLSSQGESAELTLKNASQTDDATVINLNGGTFTGTIKLESDSHRGNGEDNRSRDLQVNLKNVNVAAGSIIAFQNPSTADGSTHDRSNFITLGVGVEGAKVAGLTGTTTNAATIKATAGTKSLEIITADGADYSTNAKVESSVNLVKSGEGKQTISGAVSTTGSVKVNDGELALTGTSALSLNQLSLFDTTNATGGTLSVGSANGGTVSIGSAGSVVVGKDSVLNGNLTLGAGTALTLNGYGDDAAATINGTLSLGSDMQLNGVEQLLADLNAQAVGENGLKSLKLFNVVSVDFGDVEATLAMAADALEEEQPLIAGYDASKYFSSLDVGAYALIFQNSALYLQTTAPIPEPTTATLSLLALTALAARRRRK